MVCRRPAPEKGFKPGGTSRKFPWEPTPVSFPLGILFLSTRWAHLCHGQKDLYSYELDTHFQSLRDINEKIYRSLKLIKKIKIPHLSLPIFKCTKMCWAHPEPRKGSLTAILDQELGGGGHTNTWWWEGPARHPSGKSSQCLLLRTHLGFSATSSASGIRLTKTVYRRYTVHYGGGTQNLLTEYVIPGHHAGVVPASQTLRQEDREFKISMGCVMRPWLKNSNNKQTNKQTKSQVATVSSWFSQCYIVRPCLKEKKEKKERKLIHRSNMPPLKSKRQPCMIYIDIHYT